MPTFEISESHELKRSEMFIACPLNNPVIEKYQEIDLYRAANPMSALGQLGFPHRPLSDDPLANRVSTHLTIDASSPRNVYVPQRSPFS
jgi:hypothetical protein